jgi:choline dehydrogenase-like flavoprotein
VARSGASVIVIEAGRWFAPREFQLSAFHSMADTYRDMGASVVLGSAPTPFVQGKLVGGSSPINGAICWRTPRDVYDEWLRRTARSPTRCPGTCSKPPPTCWRRAQRAPHGPAIAGAKNQLLARGAEALGLAHRPIRRNVQGCEGLGRCMQGCPNARKLSVDATLLADAEQAGAVVLSSTEVTSIDVRARDALRACAA